MKIYKTAQGALIEHKEQFYLEKSIPWDELINRSQLHEFLLALVSEKDATQVDLTKTEILPPLQSQEIWASGVTYYRSRSARMEESQDGGDVYDRVYSAERPELFFKANIARTVGHLAEVYIRKDSKWDVPEPELTLFVNTKGEIQGYTVGNDMSSRSIEGENPLYLPQAKVYEKCAGLGPCIYVPENGIDPQAKIKLQILRDNQLAFEEEIGIDQMKRKHTELVSFLFRECDFPYGCFLMTGTGIVPPNEFTLQEKDQVNISIEGIGTLTNFIAKKP
ncbi:MAG: fumarylacetoacetate hydrolase family protein [Cyclobacteriaceae bacterium]|nr:fumarylacetoacetate hydrolase family protein [Cyclobacteriaceae bacterium SS2]